MYRAAVFGGVEPFLNPEADSNGFSSGHSAMRRKAAQIESPKRRRGKPPHSQTPPASIKRAKTKSADPCVRIGRLFLNLGSLEFSHPHRRGPSNGSSSDPGAESQTYRAGPRAGRQWGRIAAAACLLCGLIERGGQIGRRDVRAVRSEVLARG